MQTRVIVLVFCTFYYCALYSYDISQKNLKRFLRYRDIDMCMLEMAICNVGKQKLQFMCSACHLMVFNFVSNFMKVCQAVLKLWSGHKN